MSIDLTKKDLENLAWYAEYYQQHSRFIDDEEYNQIERLIDYIEFHLSRNNKE